MASKILTLAALLLAASPAAAKTDLEGCTYYDSVVKIATRPDVPPYATRVWYVPDTGEICKFLDCGGGRAPPKTTVPGCGSYKGTDTYSPDYLDLKTLGGNKPAASTAKAEPTKSVEKDDDDDKESTITKAPSSGPAATGAASASASASASSSEDKSEDKSEKDDDETTAAPSEATPKAGASSSTGGSQGAAQTPKAAGTTSTSASGNAAAMPTAAAILGPCLAAGAAIYAGML